MLAIETRADPLRSAVFAEVLKKQGYRFFAGVPCSYFRHAIEEISEDPALTYVGAANEGAALALCAGAAVTGTKAACLIQNSGFGNLVNPLTSLSQVYRIPTLLFISVRGYPDWTKDEPQHRIMGKTLPALLDVLGVPFWTMPRDPAGFAIALAEADEVIGAGGMAALLIEKDSMTGEKRSVTISKRPLSRMDAIRVVADELPQDAVVISTTGMISRDLFAIADRPRHFYMQGSMGHAMAMGLGVAVATQPGLPVVILDGDGAAIMHMGSMATVAQCSPRHFLHVVIDNEAYATTGNQASASTTARIEAVASACGYARVARCDDAGHLRMLMRELRAAAGPNCIVVKVNRQEVNDTPRITTRYSPEQTASRVRSAIAQA
jgi:phosphonopyruvate decarboxylase